MVDARRSVNTELRLQIPVHPNDDNFGCCISIMVYVYSERYMKIGDGHLLVKNGEKEEKV